MKTAEIRNMSKAEIEQTILTLKDQLFKLRAEYATGQMERPHRLGEARRTLAKCYTILKEKKSEK